MPGFLTDDIVSSLNGGATMALISHEWRSDLSYSLRCASWARVNREANTCTYGVQHARQLAIACEATR